MRELSIRASESTCTQEVIEAAVASLRKHTASSNGVITEDRPFSVLALMDKELVVGGMIGKVFWNWLYAEVVWVEEEFRGRGIGTAVMRATEEQACKMGLTGIYLWTESWQAPSFYTKLGYTQFAEFKDFPPGYSRMGFRKKLA
jgi:ribosomal protein S18 acetylase RimI-like enzyme